MGSRARRHRLAGTWSSWLLAVAMAVAWLAPASAAAPADATPPLVIGSELAFPPYADVDADGQPSGFSVELFAAVARVIDIPVQFRSGHWSQLWQALRQGEIDALPMVARLPEREGQAEFTRPHTIGYDSFFVRKGSDRITSLEQAAPLRILVMRSDAAHDELRARGFGARLVTVDSLADALRFLAAGQQDAVLAPLLQGNMLVNNLGLADLVSAGPPLGEYRREFAFAVPKGKVELRDRLDQGLAIVRATGEYDRLYAKWLGIHAPKGFPKKYVLGGGALLLVSLLILGLWSWTLRRQLRLRQRAESALRESEGGFRGVFDNAAVGIIKATPDGRILMVNDAICHMLGYADQELRSMTVLDITYPEDRPSNARLLEQATAGTIARYEMEKRYLRKDGTVFWGRLDVTEVGRTDGRPHYAIGIVQDITAAKRAEEHLRYLAAVNEQIAAVRDMPALMAIVRRAARELTGADGATLVLREDGHCHYADEDAIGPLWKGQRFPLESCISGWSMLHGETVAIEDIYADARIPHEAYRPTFVKSLSMVPIGGKNAVGAIGCYWAKRHQPTPKELELQQALANAAAVGLANLALFGQLEAARAEAERLAKVKSEFLANTSHEIRTPLNGILGLAQVGYRDSEGRRAQASFARIIDSGQLLLHIIDDILDISKIEAGKLRIETVPTGLNKVLSHAIELARGRARAKGIGFLVDLAPDLPANCLSDPLRLEQILLNLLANAVKFTETGHVSLTVRRHEASLIFRIEDTGIGMNDEQVARLFQPFEQADGSTTRKFGGTGLGLAISKRLTELLGGDLGVESRIGTGSVFELRLPLVETGEPVAEALVPANQASGQPRLEGISILAAEDNAVNRLVLEDTLVPEGADIVIVENGVQAVAQIRHYGATAFDLVLMDIQMPEMDGFEATRQILTLAPGLPIIGLTGFALAEDRRQCLAAGMVDHIAKPFEINTLIETVGRHARRRRARNSPPPAPEKPLASTDGPLIDLPSLEATYAHNPGFVGKLLRMALATEADVPARLRDALHARDLSQMTTLAHNLGGVAGMVMARGLMAQAKAAETASRAGHDDAARHIALLADSVDALLGEIRGHLAL